MAHQEKRFRISNVILALLCIFMALALIPSSMILYQTYEFYYLR